MTHLTAVASVLGRHHVPYLVISSAAPQPRDDVRRDYLHYLRGYWYHGSDASDIKQFKGKAFFAREVAPSYGWDGYLYKVRASAQSPYVLAENPDRQHKTEDGKPFKGTDFVLRDFIRDVLLRGAPDATIDGFDAKFEQHGVEVPTRLFCEASKGEEWETIASNMKQLGIDALLYEDESYDRQDIGVALFVPESVGHIDIIDTAKLKGDEAPEGFFE